MKIVELLHSTNCYCKGTQDPQSQLIQLSQAKGFMMLHLKQRRENFQRKTQHKSLLLGKE
jgi:hypothetical protein